MNWLGNEQMVQSLGWTLVHFLWEGVAIALVLAVALRLLRRKPAQWRYLAGCVAMTLMALAPLCTLRAVSSHRAPSLIAQRESVPQLPEETPRVSPQVDSPRDILVVSAKAVPEGKKTRTIESLFPWLVGVWAAGVLLLSTRLFMGWWQIGRWKRTATSDLPEILCEKTVELARRLGVSRPVRLLKSAIVEVPTVIGWLRPVILLPAGCLAGLSVRQLEGILAHELAHIRRHDYIVNLLQSAIETLLFYHPAVWWVSARVREERENCCDDLAVEMDGDPVGYARALATLEELRPASAQLALAATGGPLLRRVQRLLGKPEQSTARPAWPVAAIVILLLAALLAMSVANSPAIAHEPIKIPSPPQMQGPAPMATTTNKFQQPRASEKPEPGIFIMDEEKLRQLNQQWFWYRIGTNSAGQIGATNLGPVGGSREGGIDEAASRRLEAVRLDPVSYQSLEFVETQRSTEEQPRPSPVNQSKAVYTGKGRQAIIAKLQDIQVESVKYPGIELKEVLNDLSRIAKDRDPEGKGINFIFNREVGAVPDPATGLLTAGEPSDVSDVKVHVTLENVRLADILDAITRSADRPIKYSILEYAVIFSARTGESIPLETRTFNVDPNTFLQGLQGVIGVPFGATGGTGTGVGGGAGTLVPQVSVTGAGGSNTAALQGIVRNFFTASGVDLATNSGKAVFYNDRNGKLTVRATPQDLNLIDAAVQSLGKRPLHINIKTKIVRVPVNPNGTMEWKLGAFNVGTASGTETNSSAAAQLFPGAGTKTAPPVGSFTGVLTDPQFRPVLKAMEQRDGVEVLTSPEVTTESGRQAQLQVVDIKTIIFPGDPAHPEIPNPVTMELGPVVDLLARISSDGFSVEVTVSPRIVEFVGYQKIGANETPAAAKSGVTTASTQSMPIFRHAHGSKTATVWDGQTLVFGELPLTNAVFTPHGTRNVGGDTQVADGSFGPTTSTIGSEKKWNVLVFVTPTIINPDGTRYHRDDEIPPRTNHPPSSIR